jgi:endonuclease YncB( thermonuclease family)/predicted DCC family thiol-disulfide oxidoreductase YuxK
MAKPGTSVNLSTFDALLRAVRTALFEGQAEAGRAYLLSYHRTGEHIHTHLLLNKDRAAYGSRVIGRLAEALDAHDRLFYRCLQFYRAYPILSHRTKLAWAHYRLLMEVPDKRQRLELERQAARSGWTSPELEARVRALHALADSGGELESAKNVTPSKMLTPRRGTPGVCRVVADGDGLAVDLGFASYLALPGSRHSAGDFVRVTADGVEPAKDATKADLFTYRAEVLKVVDGDTLWVKIFLEPNRWVKEKLRLRDLDCPEMSTPEGKAAQRFTAALLARATAVTVCTTKPDKYDRYLADVFVAHAGGETYLNNALLANAHATIKRQWEFGDWSP